MRKETVYSQDHNTTVHTCTVQWCSNVLVHVLVYVKGFSVACNHSPSPLASALLMKMDTVADERKKRLFFREIFMQQLQHLMSHHEMRLEGLH